MVGSGRASRAARSDVQSRAAWLLVRTLAAGLLLAVLPSVALADGSPRRVQRPALEARLAASAAELSRAVDCQARRRARRVAVLLVHGTAVSARENWDNSGYRQALARQGHRSCTVELPAGSRAADAGWKPAAALQQAVGSRFLRALNRGDETPSGPAWTTIRTTADDVVMPSGGPRPSPALSGASNTAVQRVCPGRPTDHVDALLDSVSWAATLDAIRHKGGARYARLGRALCRKRFFPYAPDERVAAANAAARPLLLARIFAARPARTEPPLRRYARRR